MPKNSENNMKYWLRANFEEKKASAGFDLSRKGFSQAFEAVFLEVDSKDTYSFHTGLDYKLAEGTKLSFLGHYYSKD